MIMPSAIFFKREGEGGGGGVVVMKQKTSGREWLDHKNIGFKIQKLRIYLP